MKSLEHLWLRVLDESGTQCGVCTTRDRKTATSRIKREGLSFLTITLPNYATDLQKGLAREFVADDLFLSFRSGTGGLPLFLGGFLQLVFDPVSGMLRENPSIEAIFALRQITMLMGKIELPVSDRRRRFAMKRFITTEEEIKQDDRYRNSHGGRQFSTALPRVRVTPQSVFSLQDCGSSGGRMGTDVLQCPDSHLPDRRGLSRSEADERLVRQAQLLLYNEAIQGMERDASLDPPPGFIPRHGPGATAEREYGNQKFSASEWPLRLEKTCHYIDWSLPSHRHHVYQDRVTFLTPEQERPVRVIAVPKTMKTPRIIAIEPVAMQYVQQAIARRLVRELTASKLCGPLIGFKHQPPNQQLAFEGSITGTLATLDLSDASDRVSNQHVLDLFRPYPFLSEMVQGCRSRKADVDGHGVIRLAKYASMGSALTFPVEAMLFLSIAVAGVAKARSIPVSFKLIKSLRGQVRVYGDDIVVPVDSAETVISLLSDFGHKVNTDKSFWTGQFRESCGKDYFAGHDVTPCRVRRVFPTRRSNVEEVESLVSLRNQLYQLGYWETARWLDDKVEAILPSFPIVEPSSRILGRHSVAFSYEAEASCVSRQVPLVRGAYRIDDPVVNPLDDVFALMKWFLHRFDEMSDPLEEDHLLHSGRPKSSRILLGWAPPF